jgi:Ca-activated chloride channel homolog
MKWRARSGTVLVSLISLALFAAALPAEKIRSEAPSAQDQKPEESVFSIKVNVELVTTDVSVTGPSVPELQAEDFIIYDNGEAQETTYFSRDQLPIGLALLIDSSGSIEQRLFELQIAALTALRHLKPEDQTALYAFAMRYERLSDLTEDRLRIAQLVSKLRSTSGTDIYGTLYDAAKYLKKKAAFRRQAMILISDNCHVSGAMDREDARDELLESSITLYNIVTPSPHTELPYCSRSNPFIQKIAADSGGEVMDVTGPMSLKGALEKTISSLRMQYTLGFNPSNPGRTKSFHKLSVRFRNPGRCPGCKIAGRNGYYAGVAAPSPLPEKAKKKPLSSSDEIDKALVQRIILTAGTTIQDLSEIPLKVSTAEQMDFNGKLQLQLSARIDPAAVDYSTAKRPHNYNLIAAVFYADQNGKLIDCIIRKIEKHPGENDYAVIRESGIAFSTTIPIKVKNQKVKVVVFDKQSDKIGTKFIQLGNRIE